MNRLFLSAALLLLPFQHALGADDPAWLAKVLKQANPNELAYFVGVDVECPFNREKAVSIVEGVLVRSRIKPLGNGGWLVKELYMSVVVKCLKLENDKTVYTVEVYFGNYSNDVPIKYDKDFGGLGIGGSTSIQAGLQKSVESAITSYLKVNFDLGD